MIKKVNFGVHPEAEAAGFDKMTTIIEVELDDGSVVKGQADFGKGSPANPMTDEELAKIPPVRCWGGLNRDQTKTARPRMAHRGVRRRRVDEAASAQGAGCADGSQADRADQGYATAAADASFGRSELLRVAASALPYAQTSAGNCSPASVQSRCLMVYVELVGVGLMAGFLAGLSESVAALLCQRCCCCFRHSEYRRRCCRKWRSTSLAR